MVPHNIFMFIFCLNRFSKNFKSIEKWVCPCFEIFFYRIKVLMLNDIVQSTASPAQSFGIQPLIIPYLMDHTTVTPVSYTLVMYMLPTGYNRQALIPTCINHIFVIIPWGTHYYLSKQSSICTTTAH